MMYNVHLYNKYAKLITSFRSEYYSAFLGQTFIFDSSQRNNIQKQNHGDCSDPTLTPADD